MIKANFKLSKSSSNEEKQDKEVKSKKEDLTQKEFEEFMVKSGAAGSFMVFRSADKKSELGLDEL